MNETMKELPGWTGFWTGTVLLAGIGLSAVVCMPSLADSAGENYYVGGKLVNEQGFQAAQLIKQAVDLINKNRTYDALPLLEKATALAPDMAIAHHNYAIALGKIGKSNEAIAEFQRAIALDANQPYAWISLGGLYQAQGRLNDAIATYSEFLRRFPDHVDAPKLRSIIVGLEKFRASLPKTNDADSASKSDYLADMTINGVVRWPAAKMPIRVFLQPGDGVPFFKPIYQDVLKQAFMDWQAASNGLVSFIFVDSPGKADIECSWTANAKRLNNTAEAGEAKLATNRQGIVHGTIQLLTVPLVPSLPITENRLRTTCLHEVGHALGMAGHTQNPDDIMFFSAHVTDERLSLKPRDINTLLRLYSDRVGNSAQQSQPTQYDGLTGSHVPPTNAKWSGSSIQSEGTSEPDSSSQKDQQKDQ